MYNKDFASKVLESNVQVLAQYLKQLEQYLKQYMSTYVLKYYTQLRSPEPNFICNTLGSMIAVNPFPQSLAYKLNLCPSLTVRSRAV